jgi:hypothetical protein
MCVAYMVSAPRSVLWGSRRPEYGGVVKAMKLENATIIRFCNQSLFRIACGGYSESSALTTKSSKTVLILSMPSVC